MLTRTPLLSLFDCFPLVSKLLGMIVEQGIPVRVGLVLASEEDVDAVGDTNDESWGQAAVVSEDNDLDLSAAAEEPPLVTHYKELI